tara:strand:+ start:393 stop:581 length:189 start_codon:yes stop_codon:yes gene_type:complete
MKQKMITVKIPERNLEWIKKNYRKSRSGVTSLFEYGGIDIQEVHAIADLLYHLNEAFNIEDE